MMTKTWGYWATLGWAALALFAGQFAALGIVAWWRAGRIDALVDAPYDGINVTLLRRTAALYLCQIAAGGTLADAAELLGLPNQHRVHDGIRRIQQWARARPDIREFEKEDPLFWKPSPLLVELVERGADFASLNQSE